MTSNHVPNPDDLGTVIVDSALTVTISDAIAYPVRVGEQVIYPRDYHIQCQMQNIHPHQPPLPPEINQLDNRPVPQRTAAHLENDGGRQMLNEQPTAPAIRTIQTQNNQQRAGVKPPNRQHVQQRQHQGALRGHNNRYGAPNGAYNRNGAFRQQSQHQRNRQEVNPQNCLNSSSVNRYLGVPYQQVPSMNNNFQVPQYGNVPVAYSQSQGDGHPIQHQIVPVPLMNNSSLAPQCGNSSVAHSQVHGDGRPIQSQSVPYQVHNEWQSQAPYQIPPLMTPMNAPNQQFVRGFVQPSGSQPGSRSNNNSIVHRNEHPVQTQAPQHAHYQNGYQAIVEVAQNRHQPNNFNFSGNYSSGSSQAGLIPPQEYQFPAPNVIRSSNVSNQQQMPIADPHHDYQLGPGNNTQHGIHSYVPDFTKPPPPLVQQHCFSRGTQGVQEHWQAQGYGPAVNNSQQYPQTGDPRHSNALVAQNDYNMMPNSNAQYQQQGNTHPYGPPPHFESSPMQNPNNKRGNTNANYPAVALPEASNSHVQGSPPGFNVEGNRINAQNYQQLQQQPREQMYPPTQQYVPNMATNANVSSQMPMQMNAPSAVPQPDTGRANNQENNQNGQILAGNHTTPPPVPNENQNNIGLQQQAPAIGHLPPLHPFGLTGVFTPFPSPFGYPLPAANVQMTNQQLAHNMQLQAQYGQQYWQMGPGGFPIGPLFSHQPAALLRASNAVTPSFQNGKLKPSNRHNFTVSSNRPRLGYFNRFYRRFSYQHRTRTQGNLQFKKAKLKQKQRERREEQREERVADAERFLTPPNSNPSASAEMGPSDVEEFPEDRPPAPIVSVSATVEPPAPVPQFNAQTVDSVTKANVTATEKHVSLSVPKPNQGNCISSSLTNRQDEKNNSIEETREIAQKNEQIASEQIGSGVEESVQRRHNLEVSPTRNQAKKGMPVLAKQQSLDTSATETIPQQEINNYSSYAQAASLKKVPQLTPSNEPNVVKLEPKYQEPPSRVENLAKQPHIEKMSPAPKLTTTVPKQNLIRTASSQGDQQSSAGLHTQNKITEKTSCPVKKVQDNTKKAVVRPLVEMGNKSKTSAETGRAPSSTASNVASTPVNLITMKKTMSVEQSSKPANKGQDSGKQTASYSGKSVEADVPKTSSRTNGAESTTKTQTHSSEPANVVGKSSANVCAVSSTNKKCSTEASSTCSKIESGIEPKSDTKTSTPKNNNSATSGTISTNKKEKKAKPSKKTKKEKEPEETEDEMLLRLCAENKKLMEEANKKKIQDQKSEIKPTSTQFKPQTHYAQAQFAKRPAALVDQSNKYQSVRSVEQHLEGVISSRDKRRIEETERMHLATEAVLQDCRNQVKQDRERGVIQPWLQKALGDPSEEKEKVLDRLFADISEQTVRGLVARKAKLLDKSLFQREKGAFEKKVADFLNNWCGSNIDMNEAAYSFLVERMKYHKRNSLEYKIYHNISMRQEFVWTQCLVFLGFQTWDDLEILEPEFIESFKCNM